MVVRPVELETFRTVSFILRLTEAYLFRSREWKVSASQGGYADAIYGGKASCYVTDKADGNGKGKTPTTSTN